MSGENEAGFEDHGIGKSVVGEHNVASCLGSCFCGVVKTDDSCNLSVDCRAGIMASLQEELQEGIHAVRELVAGSQLDLLEVCAPWDSPLSRAVREEGGRAMSIGVHNGYDLTTRLGFKRAVKLLRETRPRYMHLSPPCDPWSPLQNLNQRTFQQIENLKQKRTLHRRLFHHCRRLVEIQVCEFNQHCGMDEDSLHHHAGGEQPLRATSWGLSDMRVMLRLCGDRFTVHGCRHGMKNMRTGNLLRKPWGWFSTHDGVKKALELRCNHGTDVKHDLIQGNITSSTAIYPYLLCRRFAKALLQDNVNMFPVFGQETDVSFGPCDSFPFCAKDEFILSGQSGSEVPDEPLEESPEPPPNIDIIPDDSDEQDAEHQSRPSQDLMNKIRTIHRNLGHPCKEVMWKMLKDAGVSDEVLQAAKVFECPECVQRGRRAATRPGIPHHVHEKWHTVSIDTFWWKYPKEAMKPDDVNTHVIGLSMLDEATDFHAAVLIRSSQEGALHNVNGDEFRKSFSEGWVQRYPTPTILRYDEEGFMRKCDVKDWIEIFGIKLEPIAGEAAWQLGKHSRHLQVLKEQMNLLSIELGTSFAPTEVLSLALSAKNSLHQIKGYSPNQWAFGKAHNRISSYLQQYDVLPWHSQRKDLDFEESLQAELKAQKLFLEVDARRRLSRAMHSRCRPLREFQTGQLVYYFRKGRKEGSRYGGKWHGPARVLCHERTSIHEERRHAGSIVWLSHAGVLLRCAPEQIRLVTEDLRDVDQIINGPRNFSELLKQVSQQQRYLDLAKDHLELAEQFDEPEEGEPLFDPDMDDMQPEVVETNVEIQKPTRFRLSGKRAAEELYLPPVDLPDLDEDDICPFPDPHGKLEGHAPTQEGQGQGDQIGGDSKRARKHATGGSQEPSLGSGQVQEPVLQDGIRRRELSGMGGGSLPRGSTQQRRNEEVPDLRSPHVEPRGGAEVRKRRPSKDANDFQSQQLDDQERQRQGPGVAEQDSLRTGRRDSSTSVRAGGGDGVRMECGGREPSSESYGRRDGELASSHEQPGAGDARDALLYAQHGSSLIHQSVSLSEPSESVLHSSAKHLESSSKGLVSGLCTAELNSNPCELSSGNAFETNFISYVREMDVVEMEFVVLPRDVHCKHGVWHLNQKAKKNAEVCFRKLDETDKEQFVQAMNKEIDSYVSSEAVKICQDHGIPLERILQMRWVYTWKVECDENGKQTGKRAKARLIVKGFQDPRLTHLPREAPTLSNLGRNLILSQAACHQYPLRIGDIKTAFLQGKQSELDQDVFAMPPTEVRERLGMKDNEILRIAKAIYGLLNAPKQWNESLCSFLREDGWVQHTLDKCLFKRISGECVVGFLGIHVDDILCAGCGEEFNQAIDRLKGRFKFGSWEDARQQVVQYCGCEIKQEEDFSVCVKQTKFSLDIEEIGLSQERRSEPNAEITVSERTAMRQRLGALNWRATQSAPWLLATVSLLQGCVENGFVSDRLAVNKLVRLQRKHANKGMYFPSLHGPCTVVTFTDASWATRRDSSSQGGQLTLLMQRGVLDGCKSPFHILSWSSRRLRRVARSSTSAEVQMSANALDSHEFAKLAYFDLMSFSRVDLRKTDEYLSSIPSCMVCDAKNIYDGVVKVETSGLHMEEKRTAIELLAIKERLQQANVSLKWVNGDQELADGLTKPWKHEGLIQAMEGKHWRIVFDPTYQSAKRIRAARQANVSEEAYAMYCLWDLADQRQERFLSGDVL